MIINPYLVIPSGPTYDADAQAFITAIGLSTTTQKNAINDLVLDLKAANIWTKFKGIYPMITDKVTQGDIATQMKFNLKNPVDSNAAYRLSWQGGWTYSSNGATGNGTNAFADTFANLATDFTSYSAHYSYYVRNNTSTGIDIGVTAGGLYTVEGWSAARSSNFAFGGFYNQDDAGVKVASSDSTGFWVSSVTSSTNTFLRRNNTTLGTTSATSSPANTTIYIGALHLASTDSAIVFSNHEFAFASIGSGLTDLESQLFYQIVEKYQVALSRNINTLQSFYYDRTKSNEYNAYIFSTQITDTTICNAIDNLINDLKGYNIWSKMKAIYPMVTDKALQADMAIQMKFNLVNPQDANAAYRLIFVGGWTYGTLGATPNGVNSYASTFLNPSTNLTNNSTHVSFYSRTNIAQASVDWGVTRPSAPYDRIVLWTKYTDNNLYSDQYNDSTNRISYANSSSTGFYISSRSTSSLFKVHKNGSIVGTNTNSSVNNTPNGTLILSALNTEGSSISLYSTRQCAFSSIGDGLNDTEAANFYTAVNNFQTTLSRNV